MSAWLHLANPAWHPTDTFVLRYARADAITWTQECFKISVKQSAEDNFAIQLRRSQKTCCSWPNGEHQRHYKALGSDMSLGSSADTWKQSQQYVWLGLPYAVCNASLASICHPTQDHFSCLQCASGTRLLLWHQTAISNENAYLSANQGFRGLWPHLFVLRKKWDYSPSQRNSQSKPVTCAVRHMQLYTSACSHVSPHSKNGS